MEKKHAKKKDGGGLYIAICCCILVIALIGYANNVSQKNKEEQEYVAEQAGENMMVPEVIKKDESEEIAEVAPEVEEPKEEADTAVVSKAKEAEAAVEFLLPVNGKVIAEFSEGQVFYERLEEWKTHNGVDLEASVGDSVLSAMDGKVSKVFMGSLGYAIQIDHENGLSTVYGNLDENPVVAIGDNVKQGDVVGRVGQSSLSDMTDTPHLHFEVMENGKYKNPTEYFNR